MKNIVLFTQVGISLIVPIVFGAVVGSYVDEWIGTKWFFAIVMIILGIAAGFLNTYKLIMKLNATEKGEDSEIKWAICE